jgi:hypothetical protein
VRSSTVRDCVEGFGKKCSSGVEGAAFAVKTGDESVEDGY